ncbi:MAG: NADH-quinone oxidoreductase subunit L [Rickettsiaceae bacterium]|nr:NADH-quinone oxidoreductase subunit L [Rickettsiaceae bacterium]
MSILIRLVLLLPLLSAILNGFFGNNIKINYIKLVSSFCISIAAIISIYIFIRCGIRRDVIHIILSHWFFIGDVNVDWAIYVDQLTATMFLLVTSVSAVVHIYSLGYMKDDETLWKFLSYLSLFTFFMLVLVSSDNFIQLFLGWEGVGLCSYLLIGYYYHKSTANNAAIKAFIVNRVSDFAFILGIVMIIIYTDNVDFKKVFAFANNLSNKSVGFEGANFSILDIICLLIFLGCMGKSAQIGFHVWLPDAMEGPTPVSALIHAATMVTAGVFLLIRCSYIFEHSTIILNLIVIIGAITCLFAALIAIAQTDIKKIIAYSTCSQLGYMFFACGVSAYQAAMFHLLTHGFFKALLFLSAGSVIHAVHEQDLLKMGGLRTKLPITYANFWVGSLAIIGIYPFAGFYSKDAILHSSYLAGGLGKFAFILGTITALLTAIYSMKIIMLAFHNKEDFTNIEVHEAPKIMNLPLIILTSGAMFSGMFCYYILDMLNPYSFFKGTIYNSQITLTNKHLPLLVEMLPLISGIVGMFIGYVIYRKNFYQKISVNFGKIYDLLKNKFYIDELYQIIFVRLSDILARICEYWDQKVIDKFGPNGSGMLIQILSWATCRIHTGYIYHYSLYIIFALIGYMTFVIFKYLTIAF